MGVKRAGLTGASGVVGGMVADGMMKFCDAWFV